MMKQDKRNDERKDFELTPAGTHVATVYKIVRLGHIPYEYQGEKKEGHFIRIFWELPQRTKTFEVNGEEKTLPFAVSRRLTLSMGPKSNLRPLVVGMIGAEFPTDEEAYLFDVESLLGLSCLITVVHETSTKTGKKYAKVVSAAPLIDGMEVPEAVNPQVIWDVVLLSKEEIEELPEYIREEMKKSSEYRVRFLTPRSEPTSTPEPDEVPF